LFANERDTIFALATGLGKAAVAVFRVSGSSCPAALQALAPGAVFPDRRPVLRTIRDPGSGAALDKALITRFQAPRSFTGEEVAELHVTGGRAVTAAVARALSKVPGLRLAEPGEFAWRAFVNGKMDLSEVEGLADLVEAETEAQRGQAQRIAGGALRRECDAIRDSLLDAMAMVEAQLDFSDVEDAGALTLQSVVHAVRHAVARIDRALAGAEAAERLREGFVVVIAGAPNVGKSSLMNAIAGRDVAITSPFAGTTRDPIEVALDLRGYPVTLVDTAGIRETEDPIELEGVKRARQRAEHADLTLWLDDHEPARVAPGGGPTLLVRTKSDMVEGWQKAPSVVQFAVSSLTGEGVDKVLDAIADLAVERMSSGEPPLLTVERHRQAFQAARADLEPVLDYGFADAELLAEHVRRAANAMDRVVGRIGVEEVLGHIFARLCIGK
jgi:tRNA modification GTPase